MVSYFYGKTLNLHFYGRDNIMGLTTGHYSGIVNHGSGTTVDVAP